MIDRIKNTRKVIEELKEKDVSVLAIDIVYELDCQLGYEIKDLSDDDYCKLYNEIEYAYLKVENVDIGVIVECALDHMEDILNENEDFDLREECCYYV